MRTNNKLFHKAVHGAVGRKYGKRSGIAWDSYIKLRSDAYASTYKPAISPRYADQMSNVALDNKV